MFEERREEGPGWQQLCLTLKHNYGEIACPSPSGKVTEIATGWCP